MTWQQDQFLTHDRHLYRWPGDFDTIDDFIPSLDGQRLERAPDWSGHQTYPSNFKEPMGMVYDRANDKFVIIGSDESGSDVVGSFSLQHDDLTKSASYATTGSPPTDCGGHHKINMLYGLESFWFIGNDFDVYEGANPYGGAVTKRYTGSALGMTPARDTFFLLIYGDQVQVWNEADTQFDAFYATDQVLGIQYLTHYREDLLLFGWQNDGTANLYRLDTIAPPKLRHIARLPGHTGQQQTAGFGSANLNPTPWALYNDEFYFSPGARIEPSNAFHSLPIYRFNGSRVEHVDTVPGPWEPQTYGLVNWRDRLLLYIIKSTDQRLYVLHRGEFVPFLTNTYALSALADLYSLAGHLLLVSRAGGNEGLRLTQHLATDSVFTSSWLDMGHPASQKHLSRLACIVDGATTDFQVKIEYRTEAGSWTEATDQDNVRHVDVGDLGVTFYLLQIRITFTEDISPPTYPDVTLESLAATYSYGVR